MTIRFRFRSAFDFVAPWYDTHTHKQTHIDRQTQTISVQKTFCSSEHTCFEHTTPLKIREIMPSSEREIFWIPSSRHFLISINCCKRLWTTETFVPSWVIELLFALTLDHSHKFITQQHPNLTGSVVYSGIYYKFLNLFSIFTVKWSCWTFEQQS